MKENQDKFVNMECVIGALAHEHGVPYLTLDQLEELGKRAVTVYSLQGLATKITFAEICEYIICFIKTPFGARQLQNLSKESGSSSK